MPRLPPVDISPQTRLRARFWPGVIDSVATFFQSHSSSSATSWARPVRVPCPISERAMRITHVSSGLTTTQAWTSTPASPAVLASTGAANGRRTPSARPPPATAVLTMKLRRESFWLMSRLLSAGGQVHRRPDPLIGAATADVRHRVVDLLVGRLRLLLQQRRRGHDLPGLAIAALRDVERRPRLLHGMRARGRQALDRHDLVGRLHAPDRHDARAHQLAVDVHGAGAALGDAA